MKTTTIINKIINQINSNAEILKSLLLDLELSLSKEDNKIKETTCKKIANLYDLPFEEVLKKIIKKKKNKENLDLIEDNEDNCISIPIYKKIIHNEKEYYYDDKLNGIVFEKHEHETKIVGYMNNKKTIEFI
jgi:hypothetical protein